MYLLPVLQEVYKFLRLFMHRRWVASKVSSHSTVEDEMKHTDFENWLSGQTLAILTQSIFSHYAGSRPEQCSPDMFALKAQLRKYQSIMLLADWHDYAT